MNLGFPDSDVWQIGDKIYFDISNTPVEKNSYLCQDFYLSAPPYNLIKISKSECL